MIADAACGLRCRRVPASAARCEDAVAQDALEVRGVVRVHELARARQVQVVEPRQPEAQRGGAQQRRPLRALVRASAAARAS